MCHRPLRCGAWCRVLLGLRRIPLRPRRRKSFFTCAVYLLDLSDIKDMVPRLPGADILQPKGRAAAAARLFQDIEDVRGILSKLNKKPKKI